MLSFFLYRAICYTDFDDFDADESADFSFYVNKKGSAILGVPRSVGEPCINPRFTGALIIPPNVSMNNKYYPIGSIAKYAFYQTRIQSISLPESVTKIGEHAFSGCHYLEIIDLSKTKIESIKENAFSNTTIQRILLPSTLTEIGQYAFLGSPLVEVKLPDKLAKLGAFAFSNCTKLTTIDMSSAALVEIQLGLFKGCVSLSTVKLPQSLKTIHNEAFYQTAIEKIAIPNSVTSMGKYTFAYCTLISEFQFPSKIATLGKGCFLGCSSLKKVEMADLAIAAFPNDLFRDCTNLLTIKYPKSLNSFGDFAVSGTHIKELTLSSDMNQIGKGAFSWNVFLQKVDISSINSDVLPEELFRMCTHLETVTLPSKIKRIPTRCFSQCISLKSLDLSKSSITTIGDNAFYMCSLLSEITFPDSIVTIEDGAFTSCAFTEFTAPASLNNIGRQAFFSCRKLKTADLALSTIGELSDFSFAICTSLSRILFPANLTVIGVCALADTAMTSLPVFNQISVIGSRAFENCKYLKNVDLSNTAVTILNGTFRGCTNLAVVKLPNNIQRMEDSPFYQTAINPIPVPSSLTILGNSAFANTTFNGQNIPSSLTHIGSYCFAWCNQLSNIDLSKTSVKYIGDNAFYNSSIKSIQWPTTLNELGKHVFLLTNYKELKLPSSITGISISCFENSAMKSVDLSETAIIDLPNRTFAHSKDLSEVKLPNTLRSIGDHCFFGSGINRIELPNSLMTLGQAAFGCTHQLNAIELQSTLVKNITQACFFNSSITRVNLPLNCTIFEWAFALSDLTGLTGSIYHMGRYAFFYCHKLARISLGQDCSFYDVTDHCFSHCFKLTEVKLPQNLTVIHNLAFCNCTSLKQVNLAETQVRQLLYGAFANCTKLTGYNIPATCTQIGDECFLNTSIFSVELNREVTTIGIGAFRACHHLKNVDMSKTSITKISNKCFSGCFALNDIQLPEKLEFIGNYAFQHCGISYFTMPETVTLLGRMAFSGCYNLLSVDLSKTSMQSIACGAFSNCTKLSKVILSSKLIKQNSKVPLWLYETTTIYVNFFNETHHPNYDQDEVIAEYSEPHEFVLAQSGPFSNARSLQEFDLSGTKLIDLLPWFLYNSTMLSEVKLPNTLATIGEGVFANTALTRITIPPSVHTIGPSCFRNCAKLTGIDLSQHNMTTLGSSMFLGTRKLTSVNFPPNTESLGNFAFFNSSIETVNLPSKVETLGRSCFAYSSVKTINLNKTKITKIPDHCFTNATNMDHVYLHPDTTTIGRSSFMNSGLETLTLPPKVQTIESLAFAGCRKLKEATLTHCRISRLPYGVFSHCTSLETVILPNALQYVHEQCFEGCKALKAVYYFGCNVIASNALGKLQQKTDLEVLVLENYPHREFLGARVSAFYNSDLEEQLERSQCAKKGVIKDPRPMTIPDPKYPRVEQGRLMRITYKEHD